MAAHDTGQITSLLQRASKADDDAVAELMPLIYDELRELARAYMNHERAGHTLQPTALVNEAYARLMGKTQPAFDNRAHFMGFAARAMRQVLIDHARRHQAAKRCGDREQVSLSELATPSGTSTVDLLDLNDALEKLMAVNERSAKVVELRFFGSLTIAEAAEVLGVSHATVEGDWAMARAWLGRELAANVS
ncbi:MAG: sigma-70 family RNA polymerase sigma factor [Planctomycetes bacterium]|nr:sigma-70 family RNA polymerase sigma factor [Planctomycetota bacterium]